MKTKVMITGIFGQDGHNMAEFLLTHYPEILVIGLAKIQEMKYEAYVTPFDEFPNFKLSFLDLRSAGSIKYKIAENKPDYFINLAGISDPSASWQDPVGTMQVNTLSVISMLEAIREHAPNCRFFSAGSCLELSNITTYRPESPYALSKAAAGMAVRLYRKTYGVYATHGTLFNHTSPMGKDAFVVTKITNGVARIFQSFRQLKDFSPIELNGDIYSNKDWSDSREIVRGIWRILNQEEYSPILKGKTHKELAKAIQDYQLCSGRIYSVKEIVEMAFKSVGLFGEWREDGFYMPEFLSKGCSIKSTCYVKIIPDKQNTSSTVIFGDKSRALKELDWQTEIPFDKTVANMVESLLKNEKAIAIH